jgi:hypothetical protein
MRQVASRMLVAISVGLGVALLVYTPATAQGAAKVACKNVLTAKCPPNTERVCTKTGKDGCCTSSSCQAKKK